MKECALISQYLEKTLPLLPYILASDNIFVHRSSRLALFGSVKFADFFFCNHCHFFPSITSYFLAKSWQISQVLSCTFADLEILRKSVGRLQFQISCPPARGLLCFRGFASRKIRPAPSPFLWTWRNFRAYRKRLF